VLTDSKTEIVARMIASDAGDIGRLLVVGCGSGVEAAILAQRLGARVVGIDIRTSFAREAEAHALLFTCDARLLPFPDASFDYVYSFHALEHIPQPERALTEVRRVLREGGGFFIGTPNRSRLVGYVGSKNASLRQKLAWNAQDWRARLRGRFRNEHGAHAGFTASELGAMLRAVLPDSTEDTGRYYRELYRRYLPMIRFILALRLGCFVFPSVYFVGRKSGAASSSRPG
jgi:ubiquinone/menaquinone biosynthesis C-methylase UbiE